MSSMLDMDVLKALSEIRDRPIVYNVQIRDLTDERYRLTQPILVSVEKYPVEDSVIASYPELEVFGEGVTESEALLNLKFAILDLYDELRQTHLDELGDLPRSWLKILRTLIDAAV